jgi:hypothetical protein
MEGDKKMCREKMVVKALAVLACLFMLSSSTALAQELCEADLDCDGDVDWTDVFTFLGDWGRNPDNNPCPPCEPENESCEGDFDGDFDIDWDDVFKFLEDWGRNQDNMPCPTCVDMDEDGYDTCDPEDPCDTDGLTADCADDDADIYPGNIKIWDNNWGDKPGGGNMPLPCGETIQFSAFACTEDDPCYEWYIELPSTIGSTISPDTGFYTAGTDCDYLDYPVEETIVVTDSCNGNISDSVTVTVWQAVLKVLDTNAHLFDVWGQITVSMCNPDNKVKAIQVDLVDGGNDLTCTECAPDPDRAPQFICSANELEDGKCRVVMTIFNPSALISEGEGSIFTVDYEIDESAHAEMKADC